MSVMLYPCLFCVLRVCELFVKQFEICLGVFAIFF